jgi:hypothetical protein
MRSTFAALVLSLLVTGCAEEANRTGSELRTPPNPNAAYRAVVALESIGAGIDTDAYHDILAAAGAYDIDVSPDEWAWGLEGEKNLCFTLNGLNPQAQALFVDELEAIAQSATLVTVYENVHCNLIGRQ